MQSEQDTTHMLQNSLKATKIFKSFRHRDVLAGISLEMPRGKVVGLLGPNGAGKSTLMSIVTGVQLSDSGLIEIDGIDVTTLPVYARAQLGLRYLPQNASISGVYQWKIISCFISKHLCRIKSDVLPVWMPYFTNLA